MSRWTRRDLLKRALVATAGTVAANALPAAAGTRAPGALPRSGPAGVDQLASSSRERLLLDFGWHFQFGHADDPAKDFGLGARRRESQFAKSGSFLPVTRANFDDRGWRSVDLPHDWPVELPFKEAPLLFHHGAKPVGREYPETSIGWYRRVFALPAADAGKRIAIEFDGVFRDCLVMFNGHYIGENFSGYAIRLPASPAG